MLDIHGKQAIGVRAIEVLLYMIYFFLFTKICILIRIMAALLMSTYNVFLWRNKKRHLSGYPTYLELYNNKDSDLGPFVQNLTKLLANVM